MKSIANVTRKLYIETFFILTITYTIVASLIGLSALMITQEYNINEFFKTLFKSPLNLFNVCFTANTSVYIHFGVFGLVIIVLSVIVFRIAMYHFIPGNANMQQMDKMSKTVLQRIHKDKTLTSFEEEVIKPVCCEEIFESYIYFCRNNNTWKDIKKRLDKDEKIIFTGIFKN